MSEPYEDVLELKCRLDLTLYPAQAGIVVRRSVAAAARAASS
jgi:hypothetical protein